VLLVGGSKLHGCPGIVFAPTPNLPTRHLFRDFYASCSTEGFLDVAFCLLALLVVLKRLELLTIDSKLTGGKTTHHEKTSTDTSIAAAETKLTSNLDQAGSGALSRKTLGLVDFGKHGVGGLGNEGSSETSDDTRAQVNGGLLATGSSALIDALVNGLVDLLKDDELGHGVGDPVAKRLDSITCDWQHGHVLLEEDGAETRVEGADAFVLHNLREATEKAVGKGGLGDETDTGGLERAQSNVGEELGDTSRSKVDGSAVVGSGFVAEQVDALLLKKFITTELEGTLEEVAGGSRTETSPNSTSALGSDDLPEATDEAAVVSYGVELDPRLDAVKC
jgi:hypothetical protein